MHISWECVKFKDLRAKALAVLPKPLNRLPTCFINCTIVPHSLSIDKQSLEIIQATLVTIWQRHIQEWHEDPEGFQVVTTGATPHFPSSLPALSDTEKFLPVPRKGHVLKLPPTKGVFCIKRGKQTANLKHQRLKITNKPCKYSHLPKDKWLSSPGAMLNKNRVEAAEFQLHSVYNKGCHQMVWNKQFGKDKQNDKLFGKIYCKRCNREWAWMHRHHNFARTIRHPITQPFTPPQWVLQQEPLSQPTPCSTILNKPKYRLEGKQAPSLSRFLHVSVSPDFPQSSNPTASSSKSLPRAGIG